MEIVAGWLFIIVIFLFIWNRHMANMNKQITEENKGLAKSLDISLEMEVADKLAEENEQFELERVETDNWRNKI